MPTAVAALARQEFLHEALAALGELRHIARPHDRVGNLDFGTSEVLSCACRLADRWAESPLRSAPVEKRVRRSLGRLRQLRHSGMLVPPSLASAVARFRTPSTRSPGIAISRAPTRTTRSTRTSPTSRTSRPGGKEPYPNLADVPNAPDNALSDEESRRPAKEPRRRPLPTRNTPTRRCVPARRRRARSRQRRRRPPSPRPCRRTPARHRPPSRRGPAAPPPAVTPALPPASASCRHADRRRPKPPRRRTRPAPAPAPRAAVAATPVATPAPPVAAPQTAAVPSPSQLRRRPRSRRPNRRWSRPPSPSCRKARPRRRRRRRPICGHRPPRPRIGRRPTPWPRWLQASGAIVVVRGGSRDHLRQRLGDAVGSGARPPERGRRDAASAGRRHSHRRPRRTAKGDDPAQQELASLRLALNRAKAVAQVLGGEGIASRSIDVEAAPIRAGDTAAASAEIYLRALTAIRRASLRLTLRGPLRMRKVCTMVLILSGAGEDRVVEGRTSDPVLVSHP